MANVTDILIKTKTSTPDVSSTAEKDSVKEQPSLFDSLLKESFSKDENIQDKVESNKAELNKETNVLKEVKTETIEEKVEIKTTSNSLLDRLIIEAKNELSEDGTKSTLKNILQEIPSETETLNLENIDNSKNEDIKNSLVVKNDLSEEIVNNQKEPILSTETELEIPTTKDKELINTDIETKVEEQTNSQNIPIVEELTTEPEIKENLQVTNPGNDVIVEESKTNTKKDLELVLDKATNKENKLEKNKTEDKENKLEVTKLENKIKEEILVENIVNNKLEIKVDENKTEESSTLVDESLINKTVENNILIGNETKLTDTEPQNIVDDSSLLEIENTQNQTVSKNIIDPENKPEEKKSLMDILIQKNMEKANLKTSDQTETVLLKGEVNSKELISNIYLSEQKNLLNNQVLFNKGEAISLLKDGASLKDIEKSANILDLGLENLDLEQNIQKETLGIVKKEDLDTLDKKNILDSLLNEKNIRTVDIKNLITKSVDASAALLDNTLNVSDDVAVNVNFPLSYNIQSKIIGAKQQMSTMMSDIARQMYENYKPPVTVFRINLNPVDLGNIAILMKNDRNNGLSISMSISNPTTLDTFVDNQNVLRNSLNKTFNDHTEFNLDFSSSTQSDSQSSNNQNSQSNQERRFERQMDTQNVLQLKEENKNREENIDYM
jgi:hypothetical protein